MKANKYDYLKIIQQNYGQGWEDVSEYETNSTGAVKEWHTKPDGKKVPLVKHDFKEYNLTGYPTRVIRRKTLAQ